MAKCPFAIWRPLPENAYADLIDPRIVILHTAVSSASSLFPYFSRDDVKVETHFYVRSDGKIEQYLDTTRQADGNRDANDFAISVENQDNAKDPILPMTPNQLIANIDLFRWLSDVHPKIKRQRCDRWDGSGYGYHSMWGAPSRWTPSAGKTCPTPARIKQFNDVMIPVLTSPVPLVQEDEDMLPGFDKSAEDVARATVRELCDTHWGKGIMNAEDQNFLVNIWKNSGREALMIRILDHSRNKE